MPRQAPIPAPGGAFDADAVWTLFEGRTDRMRHVWKITRSTLPGYMDGLSAAVEGGDWVSAARHAHSLAGSASNFGAHALVATARRIEDQAGEGAVPGAEVQAARTQFDALCAAMTAWLDQVSSPPEAPPAG
ncbi:MAG TPA: Hpt domain-containing protein [Vicinamibacterales bacterium]|nr:Hpt domain-containing protein [Vicinamibacterales bacterium]